MESNKKCAHRFRQKDVDYKYKDDVFVTVLRCSKCGLKEVTQSPDTPTHFMVRQDDGFITLFKFVPKRQQHIPFYAATTVEEIEAFIDRFWLDIIAEDRLVQRAQKG